MKKIILALTMIMSLGMASLGFASPASDLLNQEENTVNKVLALLQGKGSYEDASAGFAPALQKNFNPRAVASLQKGVKEQLGTISDTRLYRLQKAPNADFLVYLGKSQKAPNVQMNFIFEVKGKKALLQSLQLAPIEVKQASAQQQAAK